MQHRPTSPVMKAQVRWGFMVSEAAVSEGSSKAHRYRHPKGSNRRIMRMWGPSSFPGHRRLAVVRWVARGLSPQVSSARLRCTRCRRTAAVRSRRVGAVPGRSIRLFQALGVAGEQPEVLLVTHASVTRTDHPTPPSGSSSLTKASTPLGVVRSGSGSSFSPSKTVPAGRYSSGAGLG